jgi:hypothetical protein
LTPAATKPEKISQTQVLVTENGAVLQKLKLPVSKKAPVTGAYSDVNHDGVNDLVIQYVQGGKRKQIVYSSLDGVRLS